MPLRRRLSSTSRRAAAAVTGFALLAGGLVIGGSVAVSPAVAAAGTPGTPQAPTLVYSEGFENGTGTALEPLTAYTGAAPQLMTYGAAPSWLASCNGNILEFNSPDSPLGNCSQLAGLSLLRQMAYVLGVNDGAADPSTNHVVSAYTDIDPGANLAELQTLSDIPLASSAGRFFIFTVDGSATNCAASAPSYQFSLTNGGSTTPVGSPIDACTSTKSEVAPTVGNSGSQSFKVGTYTSNGSVLFTGTSAGILMTNTNGLGTGNDAAFDNIRLLDATPQLDKSFSPTSLAVNTPSTLTFTITNTTDLVEKDGWSFTDTLPAGLTATNTGTTTCPSGAVTTAVGATTVHATGNLSTGTASCTVTVGVTAPWGGAYTNGAANVVSSGLDAPANATVTFVGPAAPTSSTADPALASTGAGAVLPFVGGGALLLLVGGALLFFRTRRRRAAR